MATGNWGCGAFNGSKHLKSIIQLMACCANNRPLVYFTFGDAELRDELYKIYGYLVENKMSIGKKIGNKCKWNFLIHIITVFQAKYGAVWKAMPNMNPKCTCTSSSCHAMNLTGKYNIGSILSSVETLAHYTLESTNIFTISINQIIITTLLSFWINLFLLAIHLKRTQITH